MTNHLYEHGKSVRCHVHISGLSLYKWLTEYDI